MSYSLLLCFDDVFKHKQSVPNQCVRQAGVHSPWEIPFQPLVIYLNLFLHVPYLFYCPGGGNLCFPFYGELCANCLLLFYKNLSFDNDVVFHVLILKGLSHYHLFGEVVCLSVIL